MCQNGRLHDSKIWALENTSTVDSQISPSPIKKGKGNVFEQSVCEKLRHLILPLNLKVLFNVPKLAKRVFST